GMTGYCLYINPQILLKTLLIIYGVGSIQGLDKIHPCPGSPAGAHIRVRPFGMLQRSTGPLVMPHPAGSAISQ
ncbi:MAG: hypothetical protein ACE5GZ_10275, partial [Gammaproteobacteria bacterium]